MRIYLISGRKFVIDCKMLSTYTVFCIIHDGLAHILLHIHINYIITSDFGKLGWIILHLYFKLRGDFIYKWGEILTRS